MTNSWADLFFFKFKLVVIWFFTREPFIVTDKCDYRKLIPSRSVEVKEPKESCPPPLQILAYKLTLCRPGEAGYAHMITIAPPLRNTKIL